MFMEERHQQIAAVIRKEGKITIADITASFGISDESARRDLRLLEQQGICKRTHGGAIQPQQVGSRPPANRDFDHIPIFDTYREIARNAAAMIRANDVVYLPGGSFGHILLSLLPRNLSFTAVVNTVDMGKALREFEHLDVYMAGGKMRPSGSVVDSMATEFISRLHFDIAFLTGAGLTAGFGLSNGTDETAAFQRAVIRNSRKKVLLIPGAKVGTDAFIQVCPADAFDTIITDWECEEDQIDAIEERGVSLIVAEEPK